MSLMLLVLAATACGSGETEEKPDDINPDPIPDPVSNYRLDPAPTRTKPGEYTCNGCPDTDIASFELSAGDVTQNTFDGTVRNAQGNGTFFVGGANGQELVGTIETDPDTGEFSFNAPLFCGEQLVKCVWSNASGTYVLVTRVFTTNCVTPDIRATLSWDDEGYDWELHLIKPGGRINDDVTDCTWTTCVGQGPDWGVPDDLSDDPKKDVDDTDTFGPENIFLSKPENGTYHVYVEHWGSGGSPTSDGQLVLNVAGKVTIIDIQDLPSHYVWKAATITWPEGVVTPFTEKVDCSGDWVNGCRAAMP
ncbi:YfaP family protein [Myxococcus sp. RHSTA-1-4]|uniref:YfaP family protein n=1 Tax=Myxococcus sp. RHSTA-1-4 TaxID=2874601 RepID=UPI001CBFE08F|nr:hypothetical protein [Myxococcus sp. RHSTA-1-4]MBZ4422623.1 hypothetical protein [Myxococcus sp. RHSTA-1-4]